MSCPDFDVRNMIYYILSVSLLFPTFKKFSNSTLQSNVIDSLDFSQTPQVSFLDLSENRLASIHGLEHCQDLLELNLDENRIARIGTISTCRL